MSLTVLQIIPALGTGGAEQACVDVAAALIARGDKAVVVSSGGYRVDALEKLGALHLQKNVASKNPVTIIQNAFWLASVIRKHAIGVVHARSRAPAWTAYIACLMTGCPFVTTFHAAYKFSSAPKKLYNSVMARAGRVIAISGFIEKHIKDNYPFAKDKVRLVNRGIDLFLFDPTEVSEERIDALRTKWGLDGSEDVVLLPARLSPIKNHRLIIDAIVSLKKSGKSLPVVFFVGDDQGRRNYSQELQDRIENDGLKSVVRLAGACSDMPAALRCASLVVMPSKVPEGFGRVPVEAMAMGVPVIASNLGATRETVVEDQTGWLLPPDDPEVWAARIESALAMSPEERKRIAAQSRARVSEHYDLEQMKKQTLAVYDECAAKK